MNLLTVILLAAGGTWWLASRFRLRRLERASRNVGEGAARAIHTAMSQTVGVLGSQGPLVLPPPPPEGGYEPDGDRVLQVGRSADGE